MKKCACCGKTGLFLELNRDGACRQCAIDQKHVLNESLEKTVERLATLRTSEMEKVRVSLNAQQRINERSRRNFEEIFRQYQKATQLSLYYLIPAPFGRFLATGNPQNLNEACGFFIAQNDKIQRFSRAYFLIMRFRRRFASRCGGHFVYCRL